MSGGASHRRETGGLEYNQIQQQDLETSFPFDGFICILTLHSVILSGLKHQLKYRNAAECRTEDAGRREDIIINC